MITSNIAINIRHALQTQYNLLSFQQIQFLTNFIAAHIYHLFIDRKTKHAWFPLIARLLLHYWHGTIHVNRKNQYSLLTIQNWSMLNQVEYSVFSKWKQLHIFLYFTKFVMQIDGTCGHFESDFGIIWEANMSPPTFTVNVMEHRIPLLTMLKLNIWQRNEDFFRWIHKFGFSKRWCYIFDRTEYEGMNYYFSILFLRFMKFIVSKYFLVNSLIFFATLKFC